MNIGLPEGVQLVRFGRAEPDDFEIVIEDVIPTIRKGPRPESTTQVIVIPAEGWTFAPRYDIRAFERKYEITKKIPPADIVAKFRVTNEYEATTVKQIIENLRAAPGFVAE